MIYLQTEDSKFLTCSGTGAEMDIVVSSVRAYVGALNKMLSFENRSEENTNAATKEEKEKVCSDVENAAVAA